MTFIAGLRHDGMTAPWVRGSGPMDGPAFITYIKTQLAPTLQKGDVVVMDNLPRSQGCRSQWQCNQGARRMGCYSCHHIRRTLNPIAAGFLKGSKHHMTEHWPREPVDTLWKGVGEIARTVLKTWNVQTSSQHPDMDQTKPEML